MAVDIRDLRVGDRVILDPDSSEGIRSSINSLGTNVATIRTISGQAKEDCDNRNPLAITIECNSNGKIVKGTIGAHEILKIENRPVKQVNNDPINLDGFRASNGALLFPLLATVILRDHCTPQEAQCILNNFSDDWGAEQINSALDSVFVEIDEDQVRLESIGRYADVAVKEIEKEKRAIDVLRNSQFFSSIFAEMLNRINE
jgi:hypothetical protein